jgi:hypothetical protein
VDRMKRTKETSHLLLQAAGLPFAFPLLQSNWQLDEIAFRFFQLDTPTIYGDRRRDVSVNQTLANYFIARCFEEGQHESVNKQETFLLARLAPFMRAHGSRRFLPDSRGTYLIGDRQRARTRAVRKLTDYLECTQGKTTTLAEFSDSTKKHLDQKGTVQQGLDYARHKWKVLHHDVLQAAWNAPEQGVDQAVNRWRKLTKRRHFDQDERFALDAFAYEARAAVRRCYATMWRDAVNELRRKINLDDNEYRLHLLMHCELPVKYISPAKWQSAFHGHIFGLHPASELLLCTQLGRRLIKDVAMAEKPNGSFERFLYGLNLALHQWHGDYVGQRDSRRKAPQNESSIGSLEELEANQHRVKKKRKPPSDK